MKIYGFALSVAVAIASPAFGQQLSCTTPAILKEAKVAFATNLITEMEQQMSLRGGLSRMTSPRELSDSQDIFASSLTIKHARTAESKDPGFNYCAADIFLSEVQQYQFGLEYRYRKTNEYKSGFHIQVKASLPPNAQGAAGFNLLVGVRNSLVEKLPGQPKQQQKQPEIEAAARPAEVKKVEPSFTCYSENGRIERMICASDELSKSDAEVASLYREAYRSAFSRKADKERWAIEDSNAEWLRKRASCTDEACLLQAYAERLKELRAQ